MEIKYCLTKPILCPFDKKVGAENNISVQVGSMICRRCKSMIKMSMNKQNFEYTVTCNYGEVER